MIAEVSRTAIRRVIAVVFPVGIYEAMLASLLNTLPAKLHKTTTLFHTFLK